MNKDTKKIKSGWIRFSGVIGISVFALLIFLISYYGLAFGLKYKIMSLASNAWGAKVEIDKVNFSVSPIGLSVRGVAMTDPDKTMENLLVIESIKVKVNLYQLVVGRFVIENVGVEGISLHEKRETDGALPKKKTVQNKNIEKTKKLAKKSLEKIQNSLPSVDDILEQEKGKLLTQQAIDKVQASSKKIEESWNKLQNDLPKSEKLAGYKKQFQALTKNLPKDVIGLKKRQIEFEQLKKQIEKDKQKLDNGQKLLRQQLNQLKIDIKNLKEAPKKDFNNLQSKFSLDSKGLANMTKLLLGPKVNAWLDTAKELYSKVKPLADEYLVSDENPESKQSKQEKRERKLGKEVAFKEYDPEPNFIIHSIKVSANIEKAKLMMEMNELNFEHPKFAKTTNFKVLWRPSYQSIPLTIDGNINHIIPQAPLDTLNASWNKYKIENWTLLQDERMSIRILQAKANFTASGRLVLDDKTKNLTKMLTNFTIDYKNVKFDLSKSKSKEVKEYIAPGFQEVNTFKVKGKVTGTIWAPKIDLSSDLDKHLENGYRKVAKRRINAIKKELYDKLQKQAQEQIKPVEAELKKYLGDDFKLTQDIGEMKSIIQSKFSEHIDKEKQKLTNEIKRKVQDEINKKKAELEAEKKRQQKKLEQQAREKLKNLIRF